MPEIPPRHNASAYGGDRPERKMIRPRPSLDDLRDERRRGRNVHAIIRDVLRSDAERVFGFFRGDPASGFPSLDPDMMALYDIHSATEIDFGFYEAFSYVARELYPLVPDAAQKLAGEKPLFPPGAVEATMSGSEEQRKAFAEHVTSNPQLHALVTGEVLDALESDPSGITWLQFKVLDEFGPDGLEAKGAKHVITGVKKLYEELSNV